MCAIRNGRGPFDVPVVKEECVNHVSMRLGTRLRKLKAELKVDQVTKAAKHIRSLLAGAAGLTDIEINMLQSYYAISIRSHDNIEDMREAVLSSYFHAISTEKFLAIVDVLTARLLGAG